MSNFWLYYRENKLHTFNQMIMMSILYLTNTLS